MTKETFKERPQSASEFFDNAHLILAMVQSGTRQKAIAGEFAVKEALISDYLKVARRWPAEAIELIRKNPDAFPPRSLTSLAHKTFSDLRGGDPSRKSRKPSLIATLRAIAEGRRPRSAGATKRDPERLLIQERTSNQELRQRIRNLETQLAQSQDSRQPLADSLSADLGYLRELLINKYSVRVELDRNRGVILFSCGTAERFEATIDLLITDDP